MRDKPEPNGLRALLKNEGVKRRYTKGQVLQDTSSQTSFHLVTSGYIKRYLIDSSGSLNIQVIYGPGDILPLTLVFKILFNKEINGSTEIYYYEAMCETSIRSMDASILASSVENNPILYRELLLGFGGRLSSTLHGLENIALRNSSNRLAHQLVFLAYQFGQKRPSGVQITVPLTHQDIADMLSVTRETVSTGMSDLKKRGLIKPGRYITIPSLSKLEKAAHD